MSKYTPLNYCMDDLDDQLFIMDVWEHNAYICPKLYVCSFKRLKDAPVVWFVLFQNSYSTSCGRDKMNTGCFADDIFDYIFLEWDCLIYV